MAKYLIDWLGMGHGITQFSGNLDQIWCSTSSKRLHQAPSKVFYLSVHSFNLLAEAVGFEVLGHGILGSRLGQF
jgi:hypothetical protein